MKKIIAALGACLLATIGIAGVSQSASAAVAPPAPVSLHTTSTSSAITLSWQAGAGNVSVTKWVLFRDGSRVHTNSASVLSYTFAGLAASSTHTLGVRAIHSTSSGTRRSVIVSYTATTSGTAAVNQPPTGAGVLSTIPTDTTMRILWTGGSDPDGYVAGYNVYVNGALVKFVAAPTQEWTVTGLTPGTSYLFDVRTVDNLGALGPDRTITSSTSGTAPSSSYPLHTNIVATSFWVGEIFNASLSDGSQICSTYDAQWAYHFSGKNLGTTPSSAGGCVGSFWGGCDGVVTGSTYANYKCATETRTAANGYFPKSQPALENPFYLDLPFDDLNDSTAFNERCSVIPWAAAVNAATGVNHCADSNFSYMKNAWVQIKGPNGQTCYGQIEDAGPSSGSAYHDANYVFGSTNARPLNKKFSGDPTQGAGMDVSPALNGCLGFAALDGDNDHVSWNWVDAVNVPAGPWKNVVTHSGVTN